MGDTRKIVGIVLVKNEERFLHQVVRNIVEFCDEILIADNQSTDSTPEIIASLQKRFPLVRSQRIAHPSISHEMISCYANTPTWVFGVDGDEIYDPAGLSVLRCRLLAGEYSDHWVLFGHALHCIELDENNQVATGYLSPPCRSMTKLYNFSKLVSWDGPCPERLHGGNRVFHEGHSFRQRFNYHETTDWQNSLFKCLHLCFLPRSVKDHEASKGLVMRPNISDLNAANLGQRIWTGLMRRIGVNNQSDYKKEKYMRGPLVTVPSHPFFTTDDPPQVTI